MPDRETPDGASEGPPQEPLAGSNGQGGSNQNPPPNEDGGSAADDQDRTERLEGDIRTGERWLVGFAAAGVIVNVLIFCVYFGQLTQMTEATKAATKSANTAADSFEISNGNFDRTMAQMLSQVAVERAQIRVDQRAWLWVNIPVAPQWEIGKNITITIKILDSGKTAALNVHGGLKVELLPTNQPPDFVYKIGHQSCDLNVGFIFPNTSDSMINSMIKCYVLENDLSTKPHILTADDQQLYAAGKIYIAYFGLIRYNDAFGVSHWVQFCEASFVENLKQITPNIRGIKTCQSYQKTDSNLE
jgi:hypothetical protein